MAPSSVNHLFIPDTQVRPGIRLDYIRWAGQYTVDHFLAKHRPVKVIQIGDWHDMPSLSSYDKKGGRKYEGRRVVRDFEAGNEAWQAYEEPILDYLKANPRERKWVQANLEGHYFHGNHEDRITRAIDSDASIEGLIGLDMLKPPSWFKTYPFLKPVTIDGVVYAHYFQTKNSDRPMSGENLQLRLKNLGHSFSMGHQQELMVAIRFVNGQQQRALVAGAYYVHDEDYKGPQGNAHWRGLIVKHGVKRGGYDIMEVGIDYLCERYENVAYHKYKTRHYS